MTVSRRTVVGYLPGVMLAASSARQHATPSPATGTLKTCWLCDISDQLMRVDPDGLAATPLGVAGPVRVVPFRPGYVLVEDASSRWWLVDIDGRTPVAIGGMLPAALTAQRELAGRFTSREWRVERTSVVDATTIRVRNRMGDTIISASFPRRIEIAASTVSPSSRWTVFVQGNNLSTEVTVIDAANASSWRAGLRLDAPLAPYAISIAFRPDEAQVVIAMQRASNPAPEVWIIDLGTRRGRRIQQEIGFVLAWTECGPQGSGVQESYRQKVSGHAVAAC